MRIAINGFIALTAILSTLFSGQAKASDNPPIKDGNPCIEDLCINTEVKNLPQLNWNKARTKNLDYSGSMGAIGDPGAAKIFSRYWAVGEVDGAGLQALGKIKGFCTDPFPSSRLEGTYLNKKGQSVRVHFSIVPATDGKSQRFIVTHIAKTLVRQQITPEQVQDLVAQAVAKYGNYYKKPEESDHFPNALIASTTSGHALFLASQFGQLFDPGIPIDRTKFQYFPGCGSEEKLKL